VGARDVEVVHVAVLFRSELQRWVVVPCTAERTVEQPRVTEDCGLSRLHDDARRCQILKLHIAYSQIRITSLVTFTPEISGDNVDW